MFELASVILPTYNLGRMTAQCIDALRANTTYRPVELVWVDNGSEAGERAMVEEALRDLPWGVQEVRLEDNQGWVGGCIEGYERAAGEWIVLLNNDTMVSPGWLTAMVRALEAEPRRGIAGCVTSGGQWQGIGHLREKWVELAGAPRRLDVLPEWLAERCAGQVREVPGMVAFFAVVLRRSMLEEIEFLDQAFGMGLGDDDDLCWRARDAGWQIVVALDSFVMHRRRTTFNILEDESFDWRGEQRRNLAYLKFKQRRSRTVGPGTVLKYLGQDGSPYVIGIPARDLTEADLVELDGQGIAQLQVLATGLYVEVTEGLDGDPLFGPGPFCGARLTPPGLEAQRCRARVKEWGERCEEHGDY